MNAQLLEFWNAHAAAGRIGLFHLDFAPAKLVNWGQRFYTADGRPSPWVHAFLFLEKRENGWWIAESDMNVPLPGFRKKATSGPQINPIVKWCGGKIDRALIVDCSMASEQTDAALGRARELSDGGYTYRIGSLMGALSSGIRRDPSRRSRWSPANSMHCAQFVRVCLREAGVDPWGGSILPENTAPDLLARTFAIVAEWSAANSAQ